MAFAVLRRLVEPGSCTSAMKAEHPQGVQQVGVPFDRLPIVSDRVFRQPRDQASPRRARRSSPRFAERRLLHTADPVKKGNGLIEMSLGSEDHPEVQEGIEVLRLAGQHLAEHLDRRAPSSRVLEANRFRQQLIDAHEDPQSDQGRTRGPHR